MSISKLAWHMAALSQATVKAVDGLRKLEGAISDTDQTDGEGTGLRTSDLGGGSGKTQKRTNPHAAMLALANRQAEQKKAIDKTVQQLEKMFGDLTAREEKMLSEIAKSSVGFYDGMNILMRISETMGGLDKAFKSPTPGTAVYTLLQRLDGLVKILNQYMGRAGKQVNTDTFLGIRSQQKKKPNSGQSEGTLP